MTSGVMQGGPDGTERLTVWPPKQGPHATPRKAVSWWHNDDRVVYNGYNLAFSCPCCGEQFRLAEALQEAHTVLFRCDDCAEGLTVTFGNCDPSGWAWFCGGCGGELEPEQTGPRTWTATCAGGPEWLGDHEEALVYELRIPELEEGT